MSDTVCMFCKSPNLKTNPASGRQYCDDCFHVQVPSVTCIFTKKFYKKPDIDGVPSDEVLVFKIGHFTNDPDIMEQSSPLCLQNEKLSEETPAKLASVITSTELEKTSMNQSSIESFNGKLMMLNKDTCDCKDNSIHIHGGQDANNIELK